MTSQTLRNNESVFVYVVFLTSRDVYDLRVRSITHQVQQWDVRRIAGAARETRVGRWLKALSQLGVQPARLSNGTGCVAMRSDGPTVQYTRTHTPHESIDSEQLAVSGREGKVVVRSVGSYRTASRSTRAPPIPAPRQAPHLVW